MSKIIVDNDFLYSYIFNAEKEMLNQIPDETDIPHRFSNRFNRKMNALLKYEKRTKAMRKFVYFGKKAVASILIFSTLAFGTIMSVEAYRILFFEFITTVFEELTSIIVKTEDSINTIEITVIEPTYIPKSYSILEKFNNSIENNIIYINNDGVELSFTQRLITSSEIIIDTENTIIEILSIGNQTVYSIENKGTSQVYWNDEICSYEIIGIIDKKELINMAESIIIK